MVIGFRAFTPLCPAGHLPLEGGDRLSSMRSPISSVARKAGPPKLPISPLEGEMPGKAEGGIVRATVFQRTHGRTLR